MTLQSLTGQVSVPFFDIVCNSENKSQSTFFDIVCNSENKSQSTFFYAAALSSVLRTQESFCFWIWIWICL
jgi:hypothetical protein